MARCKDINGGMDGERDTEFLLFSAADPCGAYFLLPGTLIGVQPFFIINECVCVQCQQCGEDGEIYFLSENGSLA